MQFVESYNDYCIFLCSINLIFFTDFVETYEGKFMAGWIMCDIIAAMLILNMTVSFYYLY